MRVLFLVYYVNEPEQIKMCVLPCAFRMSKSTVGDKSERNFCGAAQLAELRFMIAVSNKNWTGD